jgi:hypothetical protein
VSVIPPNPPGGFHPNSKIREGGKVPGYRTKNGWVGTTNYTSPSYEFTEKMARAAHITGATVGTLARYLPPVDIDFENPMHACNIEEIAFEVFGPTCVRGREGSNKRLLMYRLATGETPFKKWRLEISDENGPLGAVEILGKDNYYNLDGPHPKGGSYFWGDQHPCDDVGADALPFITVEQVFKYNVRVHDYCDRVGLKIGRWQGSNNSTPRKSLDDPSLWAPSPQHVLNLMRKWPNTSENVPTHQDFVRATAMIKASFGPDREEYYQDFEAWALEYPGNDEDYVRARWESIK